MNPDWLSPVLRIVQYADAAKRNGNMSLLMSLSREGLEEMAAANAKARRRYQALGKAFANVVSEVLAKLIPSI